MTALALRSEERIGLAVAVAAHLGLAALLVWQPGQRAVPPVPERIVVTISEETGLTSTSPSPQAEAAPDVAPQLGEPAPPQDMTEPEPPPLPAKPAQPNTTATKPVQAKPAPAASPVPRPVASPRPVPRPAAKPEPKPSARAVPAPRPSARPLPRPSASAAARPAQRTAAAPAARTASSTAVRQPSRTAGGARIGDDFLRGVPGGQTSGQTQAVPAAAIGPAVRSSLASSISRQLKPHWTAPQGADAEQLVTVLAFEMNPDGTLIGRPRIVSQSGETEANRAQKARHAEQAIRAVQLAAPFDLPGQYYDAWKRVSSFRFDRRLSQ
jgi:outer membrane biosynthesis protein TonB